MTRNTLSRKEAIQLGMHFSAMSDELKTISRAEIHQKANEFLDREVAWVSVRNILKDLGIKWKVVRTTTPNRTSKTRAIATILGRVMDDLGLNGPDREVLRNISAGRKVECDSEVDDVL